MVFSRLPAGIEAPLAEVLDGQRQADLQKAARALLKEPLLTADGPYADEFRLVRRHTAELREWFERNVDYWRACNEFTFRPLFKDLEPEKPAPSIAARLRDPLVPGAALAGVIATLLIGRFL